MNEIREAAAAFIHHLKIFEGTDFGEFEQEVEGWFDKFLEEQLEIFEEEHEEEIKYLKGEIEEAQEAHESEIQGLKEEIERLDEAIEKAKQ